MIEGFGFSPEEQFGPGVLWADRHVSPEKLACRSEEYLRAQIRPSLSSRAAAVQMSK